MLTQSGAHLQAALLLEARCAWCRRWPLCRQTPARGPAGGSEAAGTSRGTDTVSLSLQSRGQQPLSQQTQHSHVTTENWGREAASLYFLPPQHYRWKDISSDGKSGTTRQTAQWPHTNVKNYQCPIKQSDHIFTQVPLCFTVNALCRCEVQRCLNVWEPSAVSDA